MDNPTKSKNAEPSRHDFKQERMHQGITTRAKSIENIVKRVLTHTEYLDDTVLFIKTNTNKPRPEAALPQEKQ